MALTVCSSVQSKKTPRDIKRNLNCDKPKYSGRD